MIKGFSGVGKSTLLKLFMGQKKKGQLTIDGYLIDDVLNSDFGGIIEVVQQDTKLFNLTIRENVQMSKEDVLMRN